MYVTLFVIVGIFGVLGYCIRRRACRLVIISIIITFFFCVHIVWKRSNRQFIHIYMMSIVEYVMFFSSASFGLVMLNVRFLYIFFWTAIVASKQGGQHQWASARRDIHGVAEGNDALRWVRVWEALFMCAWMMWVMVVQEINDTFQSLFYCNKLVMMFASVWFENNIFLYGYGWYVFIADACSMSIAFWQ